MKRLGGELGRFFVGRLFKLLIGNMFEKSTREVFLSLGKI